MTEYIEKAEIYRRYFNGGCGVARMHVSDIDVIPAADVAPVRHGRWIYDGGNEYANHFHCSECGKEKDLCCEIYAEPTPNYCENCGAKMDKEATDGQ